MQNQRCFREKDHCHVAIGAERRILHFPLPGKQADIMFNSALIYEISVLKMGMEPCFTVSEG